MFFPSKYQECSSTVTCWPSCQGADLPSSWAPSGSLGEVRIIIVVHIMIGSFWGRLRCCTPPTYSLSSRRHHQQFRLLGKDDNINRTISVDGRIHHTDINILKIFTATFLGVFTKLYVFPLRYPGDCSVHPLNSIGSTSKLGQPKQSPLSSLCRWVS